MWWNKPPQIYFIYEKPILVPNRIWSNPGDLDSREFVKLLAFHICIFSLKKLFCAYIIWEHLHPLLLWSQSWWKNVSDSLFWTYSLLAISSFSFVSFSSSSKPFKLERKDSWLQRSPSTFYLLNLFKSISPWIIILRMIVL